MFRKRVTTPVVSDAWRIAENLPATTMLGEGRAQSSAATPILEDVGAFTPVFGKSMALAQALEQGGAATSSGLEDKTSFQK